VRPALAFVAQAIRASHIKSLQVLYRFLAVLLDFLCVLNVFKC